LICRDRLRSRFHDVVLDHVKVLVVLLNVLLADVLAHLRWHRERELAKETVVMRLNLLGLEIVSWDSLHLSTQAYLIVATPGEFAVEISIEIIKILQNLHLRVEFIQMLIDQRQLVR
jgi:hypothetical protein